MYVGTGRFQPSIFDSQSISPSTGDGHDTFSLPGEYVRLDPRNSSNNPIRTLILTTRARVLPVREAQKLDIFKTAKLLLQQQQSRKAEALFREVLASEKQSSGPYPFSLEVKYNLARALLHQHRYQEAEQLFAQVWGARKVILGSEHLDTLRAAYWLAILYQHRRQWDKAEKVLKYRPEARGYAHPKSLHLRHYLALALLVQDKIENAESVCRELWAARCTVLGQEHPDTIRTHHDLAIILARWADKLRTEETPSIEARKKSEEDAGKKLTEAEEILRKVLAARREVYEEGHPSVLCTEHGLAFVLHRQGQNEEAKEIYTEVLASRRKSLGEDHEDTALTKQCMAVVILKQAGYATQLQTERSMEGLEGVDVDELDAWKEIMYARRYQMDPYDIFRRGLNIGFWSVLWTHIIPGDSDALLDSYYTG